MITEEQRLKRNAYMREWKRKNGNKVNATNLAVKAKRPEHYREINRVSMAKMRAQNPGHHAGLRHRYRDRNPQRYLVQHAKARAKFKGVPFDLVEADLVIPEFCPVLGVKLEWGVGQRASANVASPSLDRLIPELGYTKGNVRVISNRANHLKNNATLAEMRAVVAYMEREGLGAPA